MTKRATQKKAAPEVTAEEFQMQSAEMLSRSRELATEIFGGEPSADTVFEVYDRVMDADGEDEDATEELKRAKVMAQEIFGTAIGSDLATIFGVYDRAFSDFYDEEEEEETD